MNTTQAKHIAANAGVISISVKCSDGFFADIKNHEGKRLAEYRGYVPEFFPEETPGFTDPDHVMLDIELKTGKIINWRKPSPAELEKFAAQCGMPT